MYCCPVDDVEWGPTHPNRYASQYNGGHPDGTFSSRSAHQRAMEHRVDHAPMPPLILYPSAAPERVAGSAAAAASAHAPASRYLGGMQTETALLISWAVIFALLIWVVHLSSRVGQLDTAVSWLMSGR